MCEPDDLSPEMTLNESLLQGSQEVPYTGPNKLFELMLGCKCVRKVSLQQCLQMYFCCEDHDVVLYFAPVTHYLLELKQNAVFWYRKIAKEFKVTDEFLDELRNMQLFVIPVTARFLREDNPARNVEMSYAIFNQIPILPLMQEEGLEEEYHRLCITLRFLTGIITLSELAERSYGSYESVLHNYLRFVLVDNEQAMRIREAFDAYIFLNYRRRKGDEAQALMPLIFGNAFCGGKEFWEDPALPPNENFFKALREIQKESALFTMIIPPCLIKDPMVYYSVSIPFGFLATGDTKDKERLEGPYAADKKMIMNLFKGFDACFPFLARVKIALLVHELLWDIALQEKDDDPLHNLLVGLAYLYGFHVKKDPERALNLIIGAANAGLPEACEKLVFMYRNGDGVAVSHSSAIEWQQRYTEHLQTAADKSGSIFDHTVLFRELCTLAEFQEESEQFAAAEGTCMNMMECARKLKEKGYSRAKLNMANACKKMGDICKAEGKAGEAKMWYKKAEDLS